MGEKLLVDWGTGELAETEALATFNDGYSHFIDDDSCYILVNGNVAPGVAKPTHWIFPEAVEILKTLPPQPWKLKPGYEDV